MRDKQRKIDTLQTSVIRLNLVNVDLARDNDRLRRDNRELFDRKAALAASLEHGPVSTAVERAQTYYAFVNGADA